MNRKPLISISTPVYNQGPFIEQTIRSVLAQSYEHWEWIIIDDGSTDNTGDIIRSWRDERIRYHYQEHSGIDGICATHNKALRLSQGEFIALIDGDDYWPDYKLGRQIEAFEDQDVVLSYGVCCVVNQKGKDICQTTIPEDSHAAANDPTGSVLNELLFRRYSFILNSTVMLRGSAIEAIGGFVDVAGLYQDFPTWVRLSLEGRFAPLPLCLGFHRKHRMSITFNSDKNRFLDKRLGFLLKFLLDNEKKLHHLGLFFEPALLEKHWEEMRKEHIPYDHYNRTMLMLSLGLMGDAKSEFRAFLEYCPSMKHRLMYFLIHLSALTGKDLVNPSADLKKKIGDFFRRDS